MVSVVVQPTLTAAQTIQPLPIENRRSSTTTLHDIQIKPKRRTCGVFVFWAQNLSQTLKRCPLRSVVNNVETLWTIHEVLVGYHFVFALVSVIMKMLGAALLTVAALLIGATSAAAQNLKLVMLTVLAEVFLVLTFIVAMSCRWSAFGNWELDSDGKLNAESSAALSLGIVQTISAVVWCVAGVFILRCHNPPASTDAATGDATIYTKQYSCSAFHSKSTEMPTDVDSLQGSAVKTEGRHHSGYSTDVPTSLFSMPAQPASSSEQHVTLSSEQMLTCFYPQPRKLQQQQQHVLPASASVYAVTPNGVVCPRDLPSVGRSCDEELIAEGGDACGTWQGSSDTTNAKRVFSSSTNLQPRLRKISTSTRQKDAWSPVWPVSAPVSPRVSSEL